MKQPLAFRLAKRLERQRGDIGHAVLMLGAADELRRLHEENEELLKTIQQLACLGMGNVIAQMALIKTTGEQNDN